MRSGFRSARESFWFLPAVFGVVAVLLAQGLVAMDRTFADPISRLPFFRELSAEGLGLSRRELPGGRQLAGQVLLRLR